MADKKIDELPALETQDITDLYEASANGTGSFKETREQQTTYQQENLDFIHTTGDVELGDIPVYGADGKNAKSSGTNISVDRDVTGFRNIAAGTDAESTGVNSYALGRRAKATANGAYAIADNQNADFTNADENTWKSRFQGGHVFGGGGTMLFSAGGNFVSLTTPFDVNPYVNVSGFSYTEPNLLWGWADADGVMHQGYTPPLEVITITSNTTLDSRHWYKRVVCNSETPFTVTFPQQSTLATLAGVWCELENINAGTVTIAKQGDETLVGNSSLPAANTFKVLRSTTTSWNVSPFTNFVAPTSATDNGVVLFDGTTGQKIKSTTDFVYNPSLNSLKAGVSSVASGSHSFSFGRRATASANGAYMLADNQNSDIENSTENFLQTRFQAGHYLGGGGTMLFSGGGNYISGLAAFDINPFVHVSGFSYTEPNLYFTWADADAAMHQGYVSPLEVVTLTSNTTLDSRHWFKRILCNTTSGPFTVTFPQQSTLTTLPGVWCELENTGLYPITIAKQGSETIVGNTLLPATATFKVLRGTTTKWNVSPWQNTGITQFISSTSGDLLNYFPGDFIITTNNSPVSIQIPLDSTKFFPEGTVFAIQQFGNGIVTLTPETGAVGIDVPPGCTAQTSGQGSICFIKKKSPDHWVASGNLNNSYYWTSDGDLSINSKNIAGDISLVTLTLPDTTDFPDPYIGEIEIINGNSGGWKVQCPLDTLIFVGDETCASGGYIASTDIGDSLKLKLVAPNIWEAYGIQGNISIDGSMTNNAINSHQDLSPDGSPTFTNLTVTGTVTQAGNTYFESGGFNPSSYSTGTVTITDGGVTGSGTTFTSAMVNGIFEITSGPSKGESSLIFSYLSATSIELFDESITVSAGTTYVIHYGNVSFADNTMGISANTTLRGAPEWEDAQTMPGLTLSITPLAVASGGTGAATIDDARANLGFGPVNNIVTVSGTSLTLDSSHIYKNIRFTSNSAVTVTLPTSVYTAGQWTNLKQAGNGKITVVESGTTILSALSNKSLNTPGAGATLTCTTSSTGFDLDGMLQP